MSIWAIFWIVVAFLLIVIGVFAFFAFFDMRAYMIRKVGHNYKFGLAHIKVNDTWLYRESTLIFEGDDAMTYTRQTKIDGETVYVDDIVPNDIGYDYDEYTGARLYRVQPGGCIATSDDGAKPAVDYPSRLISSHVLDRTAIEYAASVNAGSSTNWRPLLIIGGIVAVVAIVVVLFFTGIIPMPGQTTPPAETSSQTETTAPDGTGNDYEIVVPAGEGQ